MQGFWYDNVKPKYGNKETKLCYMDTNSFIVHTKTEDIYEEIAKDVQTNYELDRPQPKGKNRKVIGLMKHEILGKIMKEFAALRAKT